MNDWIVSVASMLVGSGIVYGILKAKVASLEKDVAKLFGETERCVTIQQFESVISEMKMNQRDLSHDVKELIRMVAKLHGDG